MNCTGCEYDTLDEHRHKFCAYYQKTKLEMDQEVGLDYVEFRHRWCPHDTRTKTEEDK